MEEYRRPCKKENNNIRREINKILNKKITNENDIRSFKDLLSYSVTTIKPLCLNIFFKNFIKTCRNYLTKYFKMDESEKKKIDNLFLFIYQMENYPDYLCIDSDTDFFIIIRIKYIIANNEQINSIISFFLENEISNFNFEKNSNNIELTIKIK